MTGYSLIFVPFSWEFGRWDIRQKTLWGFGPFRLAIHRELGKWKGS